MLKYLDYVKGVLINDGTLKAQTQFSSSGLLAGWQSESFWPARVSTNRILTKVGRLVK